MNNELYMCSVWRKDTREGIIDRNIDEMIKGDASENEHKIGSK